MTAPAPTMLEVLESVREQTDDLDALAGNLAALLDGLPDLNELAAEREPEDITRLAQQARIIQRQVTYMRGELNDALARLVADTTPPPSEESPAAGGA